MTNKKRRRSSCFERSDQLYSTRSELPVQLENKVLDSVLNTESSTISFTLLYLPSLLYEYIIVDAR